MYNVSGVPQRVNGKVLGNLNGIDLSNIDLHSYVVTSDGRAYTAISRVEPKLGTSMLSLYTIGSVFGWLYGALTTANGKNGYSITGVPYYPTKVSHPVSFWLIWFVNRRVLYIPALSVVHRHHCYLCTAVHLCHKVGHRNFIFGTKMHICP